MSLAHSIRLRLSHWLRPVGPFGRSQTGRFSHLFRVRLELELLEDYTTPSGAISGAVWNDLNGDGVRQLDEPGLSNQVVLLDLNGDGRLSAITATRSATSTAIATAPGLLGEYGGQMASLQVQGLPDTLTNLAVSVDLANNGPDAVVVAVVSPTGLTIPNLPSLFSINPGERFVGTFDGASANPVGSVPRPLSTGTYAPDQSFSDHRSYINGTNPNGLWGLVFFGDASHLDLKSWSLTFTTPEPTTKTDSNGEYVFQNLSPGDYSVRVAVPGASAQTSPVGGAAQTVAVPDNRVAVGVDFGVRGAPDLTANALTVISPAAQWGQPVTVAYTVANQGAGLAGSFRLDLRLSADGRVLPGGPLLLSIPINGLSPGASVSGTTTFILPAAPLGFGAAGNAYVGILVDPLDQVAESDETNNGNQGAGIDLARIDGRSGVTANTPVASGPNTQQAPSIAADPTDPRHLVTAYLDYALLTTAYAGVGVATSFDGGATWSRTAIALPAGVSQGAAAPTVAFDASGRVYVSFMAATFQGLPPVFTNPDGYQRFSGFTSTNGVFVASSSDGGLTWADPVPVAMNTYTPDGPEVPFEAWPSMAVDNSPTRPDGTANPNFGSAYVAWSRFYPPGQFPGQPTSTSGSDVLVAVSRDGGQTWTTLTQTDPDTGLLRSVILDPRYKDNGTGGRGRGFVTFPTVTVGAGGDVFVSTYAGGDFTVYHSSNGGLSFTPPDYDAQTGLPFPTLNGIIVPSPSLPVNEFLGAPEPRTLPLRQNVADPSHPGRVYAVAAVNVTARVGLQAGSVVDRGDVILARSDDFGQTWSSDFTILKQPPVADRLTPAQAASFLPTLNDDNGGDQEALALSLSTQVLADQALPSIAVDGKGNVVVVWYDTRVSPLVPNDFGIVNALSVWGTVSTDGGHTFSPNFQISDTPFDPVNGQFVAGNGSLATYLGDQIGVVIADGTAFVAWADARHGRDLSNGQPFRQDVYLGSFKLSPNPSAPVDRFGGTNTFETPIDLTAPGFAANSPIDLARVVLAPGRADKWFVMQTGTSGPLIASVRGARPGDLQLEITDETGTVLLATASPVTDSDGSVLGTQLTLAATAGASYYVHVFGTNDGALSFDLSLTNLTADLGQQVQGSVTASGVQDLYRLAAGVTGTLNLSLSDPGHGLIVLNPDGFTALFDGTITGEAQVALPVSADQVVLLLVVDLTGEGGSYTLNYENEDQYSDSHTVFLTTLRDPSSVVTADFNGDGNPDLLTTSTDRTDAVGVYLGNGNGTFQAAAQYTVGAGPRGRLADNRQPAIFDVNNDGIPDAVIPNFRASDVSVLLGRGDGTFLPQRRAEVAPNPDFTAAGDFNRDGNPDVVTLQAGPLPGQTSELSVLLGRGTGEFAVAGNYPTAFTDGVGPVLAGDFTGDSVPDLLVFSQKLPLGQLFVGNGDGTFTDFGTFSVPESVLSVQALDLDGDGKLALILGGTNSGSVYMMLGNGDGTFQPAVAYIVMLAGQGDGVEVRSFAVIDFDPTSTPLPLPAPAGSPSPETQLVYGTRALVLTAQPRSGQGQAQVILLPELLHLDGQFAGFNSPVTVAEVRTAGNLTTGDFDGDGKTDVAVTDAGGVTVVYGISAPPPAVPANDSPATALNLSAATHYVSPVLSIVPSRESASFQFTVPTESTSESGPQVIDISTLARNETGPGLRMEVLDAAGDVLASGLRVRVVAQQGEVLTVRVFAGTDGTIRGYGAYTLSIDVLPQVVTAQAQSFVPGDPPASIVLTLQGDRLDPTTAEDPANYTVTWFGPDGQTRVIPVGAAGGAQSVVYNPGANVEASNGVTFPAVVRQTVTLLFEQSLPAGAYTVSLSPRIQTAAFEAGEGDQLAGGPELAGHPVVSVAGGGTVQNGATVVVAAPPSGVDPDDAESPFLTQLQNDLGAILDALLRAKGDDTSITATVMSQIVARMLPGLDPDTPFLILWLDPVSLAVADSAGGRTEYKKGSGRVDQGLQNTFVEVGGNVELLVVRGARGVFDLEVADAGAVARGGAAVISGGTARTVDLTPAIRSGQGKFEFTIDGPGVGPTPPERGDGAAANPSPVPLSAPPVLGGATGSGAGAASSGTGSTGAISPGTVPAAGVLTGSVPLLGPATGSPAGGSPAPAAPAPIGPTAIEANGRAGSVSGPAANSTTDTISGTGSVSLTHEAVVRFTAALREALIRAMTRGTLFRLAMQQFIDSVGDEGRATFECRDSAPAPASGQSRSDPLEQGTNTLTRGLADGPRTAAAEPTVTDSPEPGQAGAAASDPGQRRLAGVGSVAVLASLLWVYLAERRGQTAKSGKRLDDLPPRV